MWPTLTRSHGTSHHPQTGAACCLQMAPSETSMWGPNQPAGSKWGHSAENRVKSEALSCHWCHTAVKAAPGPWVHLQGPLSSATSTLSHMPFFAVTRTPSAGIFQVSFQTSIILIRCCGRKRIRRWPHPRSSPLYFSWAAWQYLSLFHGPAAISNLSRAALCQRPLFIQNQRVR